MAQNTFVTLPKGVWTAITNADVAADISIALIDGRCAIQATATGGSAPAASSDDGLPLLSHGDGWSEATIAEKFPGVATAVLLFGKPLDNEDARVYVSHGA